MKQSSPIVSDWRRCVPVGVAIGAFEPLPSVYWTVAPHVPTGAPGCFGRLSFADFHPIALARSAFLLVKLHCIVQTSFFWTNVPGAIVGA